MAKEIDARVKQKVATETEWQLITLPLLDGECAWVRRADGMPVNVKIGDGGKKFSELPYFIQYDQAAYVPIPDNKVLPIPPNNIGYSVVGAGTYTQVGKPDIVIADTEMGVIVNSGAEWVVQNRIELPVSPADGKIKPQDEYAVNGDTVYEELNYYVTIPTSVENSLYVGDGHYSTAGVANTSPNWISSSIRSVSETPTDVRIEGIQSSSGKNVIFYKNDDTLNQNELYLPIPDGTTSFDFTTPVGYSKMIINIARGTNIGANIDIYRDSFKLYMSDVERKIRTGLIKDRIETPQLINIESNVNDLLVKGNSFLDGTTYPKYSLGINSDKYINTNTGRLYVKKNNDWGSGIFMGSESNFVYPEWFTWRPFDITLQGNGKYVPKIKSLFEEYVKSDYNRLTKYYIDPINGNDTNDGLTKVNAFKDLKIAIEQKGARNIELLGTNRNNFYPFDLGMRSIQDISSNDPLIIIAPNPVYFGHSFNATGFSWVDQGGYYKTSRTNVRLVIDSSRIDSVTGTFLSLKKVNSALEVQDTADSWFISGADLYVNVGRAPDSNIELCFGIENKFTPSSTTPYIYMEGVNIFSPVGTQSIMFNNNTISQYPCKVIISNVNANYNYSGNGIAIDNILETYIEDCKSFGNLRDGLNYHTSLLASGYTPMKIVEISGVSKNNGVGILSENSSNGSTIHEGATIIRFYGDFANCQGSVVADVGDGCRVMCFNVNAINSLRNNDAAFRINGNGSIAGYFGCKGESQTTGTVSIKADAGSKAYYSSDTLIPNGTMGDVNAYNF